MTTDSILAKLEEAGDALRRWRTLNSLRLGAAGFLLALWFVSLIDFWLGTPAAFRITCWTILISGAGAVAWMSVRAWRKRPGISSVAACIEQRFPELDNHLINYVQFSGMAREERGALVETYLRMEAPRCPEGMIGALEDRRSTRTSLATLGLAVLLLAVSTGFWGPSWLNAMARVLNPFSDRAASTLAFILSVSPGDGHVPAGQDVTLVCVARGIAGQPVLVEITPTGDRKSLLEIGRLTGSGEETFTHSMASVTSDFEYRFRAGDAVARRYEIKALPPLVLEALTVDVRPPPYTGLPATSQEALSRLIRVPEGSVMAFEFRANRSLASAEILIGSNATACMRGDREAIWQGTVVCPAGQPLAIRVRDEYGSEVSLPIRVELLADSPPAIRIVAPSAKILLGPGADPAIQWEVSDDYGLADVFLEKMQESTNGTLVESWTSLTGRLATAFWKGAGHRPDAGATTTFRLVARDRCPLDGGRIARSPAIVFMSPGQSESHGASDAVSASRALLARLVAEQKENLARTLELIRLAAGATDDACLQVQTAQARIRSLAGEMLADPQKPLGGLAPLMRALHERPMAEAVSTLEKVTRSPAASRAELAGRAAELERQILERLSEMDDNIGKVVEHRRATDLLALLDALVDGQGEMLEATRALVSSGGNPPQSLVDRQDSLADDVRVFVAACHDEAERIRPNDAVFSALVVESATICEQGRVQASMLAASERLDQDQPAEAVPHEDKALSILKQAQAKLNAWRAEQAVEKGQELEEALSESREKLEKLRNLQGSIVDAIRQTLQQKDRSRESSEELAGEIEEIKSNMSEALLKIAKDLQIFPELPVGNELVTDVEQIYEEVYQAEGSESVEATESGLQKEDWILEALEQASERAEEMEMWLATTPDAVKRNTESFDQQELPQIPVIPLASKVEDIIGDLLEQEQEQMDKADDSATNQGSSDLPPGWGIAEGEFVNYSAQGKSGNERPDHKEQDGRSLVGRQGMSDGETTAGSGRINEGDENIETRRTQDSAQSGEVQEEGHAEAKATGGGKLSGYSEKMGMSGTGPRRDANVGEGSDLGVQAMLRREAEQLYAKASLAHVRTGSLDDAIRHMRRAEEAIAQDYSIREIREHQRLAVQALKRTQAELEGGTWSAAIGDNGRRPSMEEGGVSGGVDAAPVGYQELVSEYYKSITSEAGY